jgi:hypothetical protein
VLHLRKQKTVDGAFELVDDLGRRGLRCAGLPLNAAQAPDFTYSCQASTEHFGQCAEFPLLRNGGFGCRINVSCKIIRLSADAANPLNRSRNWRADGDGWRFAPDAGVVQRLKG